MKECAALINKNYEYHLSGDCSEYCICAITRKSCLGKIVSDPDDQSSNFFSRGKCSIDEKKVKSCPLYGVSDATIIKIVEERLDNEKKELINKIGA